ncbi:hypothetical protein IT411_02470 [Candidatus Peregrinibacteria bacterium]|nr:hypothetical protein [Candidatus Peregrinibacteria bacterium]
MSNKLKVLASSGLLVLTMGLAGCQNVMAPAEAPQKAPEVMLQEGLTKLSNTTSYSYNVDMVGDLKGPEGEKPELVKFNMNMNGGVEAKDPKDPKLNLNVKGEMSADADGGTGELAFRMNKDAIFLNLMSLEGKGSVAIPEEMKAQFINKWWTMPIPPEALEQLSMSMASGSEANMTEEQKQMKKLVEETKFFKNVEYKGMESVNGEQSYHYTGMLDEAAFSEFVAKASEMQGQTVSETEKADMMKAFEFMDFSGDFYVGKDSGALNKGKGTITFKQNEDKSSPSGTVTVEFVISNINKPVTVEVPADAQPIPMEALGGLM